MNDRAVLVLGMHRSGTSCLAGMLAAGGVASAGDAIRNWDNARGHFEMLDAVRLDEAVLARSGGHWLSPPADVRWTDEQAATRDRLLSTRVAGRPALIKDPRALLVLPFWRASSVPFHAIAIVRHPLAVARSLESWRATPIDEGLTLWTAHNRALHADRANHGYPLVDFDEPRDVMIATVAGAARAMTPSVDDVALAAAYEDRLVHHDGAGDDRDDSRTLPRAERGPLDEALALHAALLGHRAVVTSRAFPRAAYDAFTTCLGARDLASALVHAREALSRVLDAAAVLVPVVVALVKHRAHAEARALVAETARRLDDGLADLLHAKILLGTGDAVGAVTHLEAACAVTDPLHQARHLLPLALRGAGRHADARAALERVAAEALYPHGPLATLAEWSWLDGERARALAEMTRAIEAAPPHRRGRLRTRRAEWLLARDEANAARDELERAIAEDPGYERSRKVLRTVLPRTQTSR